MGDTTGPGAAPGFYQPPKLRITASYEPDNARQPTGVEIEVFNDEPLSATVIHQIVTGLAGVISGAAAAAGPAVGPVASTTNRTANSAKFDLVNNNGGVR